MSAAFAVHRLLDLAWEIRPGPHCGVTRAITHPLQAVAVPVHSGVVELTKRVAYEDCEATDQRLLPRTVSM